ncbi:UvrD-helicase-domain-containing protein [Auriscalpium vulgare]|uniref:UvrD-helicase-domain-containing protein n=1 Tax=Auriscalpium vulgare TaxID=40419 RepID=A0ACB8RCS3_9AGAM|nr:UvrD-helicase-domain-containing protein [Auriscalpium vulgare]
MPAVAAVVSLLTNLNDSQSRSVQHPPSIPLQILAGPGSGKTKVLTSRIAYLILHHHIPAHAICAVTFTNKAALEMRTRLTVLIGPSRVKQLKMGTFHALCALFLRKYGRLAGLEENFTICDADESAKVVSKYLKPLKEMLAENNITLKPRTVCGLISHAKSKGVGPKDYIQFVLEERAEKDRAINREFAPHGFAPPGTQQQFVDLVTQVVSDIYRDYELELRKSNSLDFDDLLIYGVKLFRDNKKIAKWCQHVLVDELYDLVFLSGISTHANSLGDKSQDTNGMQYDLMKFIARAHKCVTVVGDPDQSSM